MDGKETKRMDLRYITINGLDPGVERKMREDLERTGYAGSKSAYVTELCSEALDMRAKRRELAEKADLESLTERIDGLCAKVDSITEMLAKAKAENDVYRMLLCEVYWLGEAIFVTQTGDTESMRYFRKGWYDELPPHLTLKMNEVRRNYGNA